MTPDRWPQIEELYRAAFAQPAEARAAFLAEACPDLDVRREVELLLAQSASGELATGGAAAFAPDLERAVTGSNLVGRRIGVYEIRALVGIGGMGEVYRARDTRLGRDVAIKTLPQAFTSDPERLARFEREARVLASLNHPNIATIHGLEEGDGVHALVMELVDGPTLAERVAQGPVPMTEALTIAHQIAEALEAAHEKGIVHRDLKPANIKLTREGTAKVLDFGLAKVYLGDAAATDPSQIPTMTVNATRQATILGTPAYMSPEQARGNPLDKRTDIWAFGCVLYEILTGRLAFPGKTISDTIAQILEREPDWNALPARTPESIRRLLRRALEKDRKERLPDIGVARLELKEALTKPVPEFPHTAEIVRPTGRRGAWAMIATATAAAALIAVGVAYFRRAPAGDATAMRFSVVLPHNVTFNTANRTSVMAMSPDGRHLAFVANRAGVDLLWIRSLDALDAQSLPGTENASSPFWSPDGRALGFFTGSTLKTIDVPSGAVRSLCDFPGVSRWGTWSPDGVIVFSSRETGLFRVSASGGQPVPLTTLDIPGRETAHMFPFFLPDGQHFLYRVAPSNTIMLSSLDSTERTPLLTTDSKVIYVAPGWLVFARQETLLAQHFDPEHARVTGEAVPIAQQLLPDGAGGRVFTASSSGGVLAYRTGSIGGSTHLAWVDRAGKVLAVVGSPGEYRNPELSPDGSRAALEVTDPQTGTQDVWLLDLGRSLLSRLTFDPGNDIYPIWSPDGNWIMFGSDRGGVWHLYKKRANGSGSEERVVQSPIAMVPYSWSPDGRSVVYRTGTSNPYNMGILPLVGEGTPQPIEVSKFNQSYGQVSPDGRWLAHTFNESGRYEVYLRSFTEPNSGKWQVSRNGAVLPRWRHDGRELFYYAGDGRLMAVPIAGTTAPDLGAAVPLFEAHMLNGPTNPAGFRQQYDVARDGQRFLLNVPLDDASGSIITVVVNWAAGLNQ